VSPAFSEYQTMSTSTVAGNLTGTLVADTVSLDAMPTLVFTPNFATPPTLDISSASSISPSSAILNGVMTSIGNASATIEGFNYGTSTAYGIVASTTGSFGAGPFSESVSTLNPDTTYHFQAFATNSAGTGTSTDATFTTASVSSGSGGGPVVDSRFGWGRDIYLSHYHEQHCFHEHKFRDCQRHVNSLFFTHFHGGAPVATRLPSDGVERPPCASVRAEHHDPWLYFLFILHL
jgi:hypothetical protein